MQRFAVPERRTSVTAVTDVSFLDDGGRARRIVDGVHARNSQQLYGFALRLGLLEDEAADLVQEVLLRLFRTLARGDDIAEPGAWAYRTAFHLAMDRHRVQRRWLAFVERLAPSDPSTPSSDDLVAVWSEVDALPPRQRAVLYLHYRADLTYETIGRILDIDASSARANASRGLARIRLRLEER